MGIKSKNPKKKWKQGVDIPAYSNKSWKELNDLWPAEIRVQNDAWKIISVTFPAFVSTQQFMKTILNGEAVDFRSLLILCWLQRCEEAKEGIAFEAWPAMKGMNIGGSIWYARSSRLFKLGLLEDMPTGRFKMYRVTALGKAIIHNFNTNAEEAHKNLRYWISLQSEESIKKISTYLNRYCPGWDITNEPPPTQTDLQPQ